MVRVVHMEEQISQKLEAIPGASSVGISRTLPMDGSSWTDAVFVKGENYAPGEVPPMRWFGF